MNKVGWGEVLDYIGVEWRQTERQTSFLDAIDDMYPSAEEWRP